MLKITYHDKIKSEVNNIDAIGTGAATEKKSVMEKDNAFSTQTVGP